MITLEKVITSIDMRFTKQGALRGVAVYERLIAMQDGERVAGSKDQELDPRPLSVDDAATLSFINDQAMSAMNENVRLLTELAAAQAAVTPLKNDLEEANRIIGELRSQVGELS